MYLSSVTLAFGALSKAAAARSVQLYLHIPYTHTPLFSVKLDTVNSVTAIPNEHSRDHHHQMYVGYYTHTQRHYDTHVPRKQHQNGGTERVGR